MNTASIVQALRHEKERIEKAISALEGVPTNRRVISNGRRKRRTRKLSAAAKKRISQAAKARWAAAKKAGKNKL